MSSKAHDSTERMEAPASLPIASLLVYSRAGSAVVPLEEGLELTVGRGEDASVVVPDSSLSRLHARIERAGGRVVVTDLGSTNGVLVNGVRVERAEISPGDEVRLGAARLSLHDASHRARLERSIVGPETLRLLLDHELVRARHYGRPLTLALVRGAEPTSGIGPRAAALAQALRPVDRLSFYGPGALLVLLPELDLEEARRRLAAAPLGVGLFAGLAAFPGAATSAEALIEAARNAAASARPTDPIAAAPSRGAAVHHAGGDDPVVVSPALERVFELARQLAPSSLPVIIEGESGAGKEVVARAIHHLGPRAARPLISLNCASVPPQLVEATLFGHERGAFTGAERDAAGIFEAASGGTVFLDEIGELPAPVQAALLRVLETQKVVRVGSTREVDIDVRVLAATHRDLEAAVTRGEFRSDLLFRLDGMRLVVPPLRDRTQEIEPLALRFLARSAQEAGRAIDGIEPEALERLCLYPWPGNVRELRNTIARAVVVARGSRIGAEDLPERVQRGARTGAFAEPPRTSADAPEEETIDLREALKATEARIIVQALRLEGWNQAGAARRLKIPVRTLTYKIRALGIRKVNLDPS